MQYDTLRWNREDVTDNQVLLDQLLDIITEIVTGCESLQGELGFGTKIPGAGDKQEQSWTLGLIDGIHHKRAELLIRQLREAFPFLEANAEWHNSSEGDEIGPIWITVPHTCDCGMSR